MKKILLSFILLTSILLCAYAQEYQKPKTIGGDTTGTQSSPQQSSPTGTVKPSEVIEKGTINPVKHNEEKDVKENKKEEKKRHENFLKKLKRKCNGKTNEEKYDKNNTSLKNSIQSVPPTIISSWFGGQMTNSSPPDNTMAISNNGNIIAADNERIHFYTSTGTLQGSYTYNSFFSANEGFTDPHVLYDSGADRFIFVIQCGANAVEKIRVGFSISNNPFSDGFHIYTFDIAALTGSTIDYPNIAVSTDELFVTGNLGSLSNILFQFDKYKGYSGGTISYKYFTGIADGGGVNARALFPVSWGQQGNYGPGIYMIASEASPSIVKDKIYFYDVTDNQYNNSQVLLKSSVSVPTFTIPSAAVQLGTSCGLDPAAWDNVTGGFYLNGIIHFCYMMDDGNGYSKVSYNRLNVSNFNISTAYMGSTNSDYRFASVASIGTNTSDKSVVVGLLRSDNSVYPEIRYKYYDDAMNPTTSSLVKAGDNYVCYTGNSERWGDYTYIQRRFNTSSYPVVWFAGCYGNSSNKWSTWVSEIGYQSPIGITENDFSNNIEIYPNPNGGNFTIVQKKDIQVLAITVLNELGQKILFTSIPDAKGEINLSTQPNGIYFLQIKSANGITTKNIIIDK